MHNETPAPPEFDIRPVTTHEEGRACVALQELIWGPNFSEAVPAALLWVAHRTGGVVAAAWDGQEAVGLVFGITGWVDGHPFHWSDLLAVHPRMRGQRLGRELKRYQRRRLEEAGVALASWTFDPLDVRNAWLNFSRFGGTAHEYLRNAYGASQSPLHAGLATDRLVITWRPASDRVLSRMEGGVVVQLPAEANAAPVVNPAPGDVRLGLAGEWLALKLPLDIHALRTADLAAARQWRADTRRAFESYFAAGYEAVEMTRHGQQPMLLLRRAEP